MSSLVTLIAHLFGDFGQFDEASDETLANERNFGANRRESLRTAEMLIAVDPEKECIVVKGAGPLRGSSIYPILCQLIQLHREDLESGRLPRNFRCLPAKAIADELEGSDEDAVRQAITRARKKVAGRVRQDMIEHVKSRGYRLNPAVRVVALDQLQFD